TVLHPMAQSLTQQRRAWSIPSATQSTFALRARLKAGGSTPDLRLSITCYDTAGAATVTNSSYTPVPSGSWTQLSVTATSPSNTKFVELNIQSDETKMTSNMEIVFD